MSGEAHSLADKLRASKAVAASRAAMETVRQLRDRKGDFRNLKWAPLADQPAEDRFRPLDLKEEFPGGVTSLVSLDVQVHLAVQTFFPHADLKSLGTMPMLARAAPTRDLPGAMRWGFGHLPNRRPVARIVAFVPFPEVGADEEHQFNPQFFVRVRIPSSEFKESSDYFVGRAAFDGGTSKGVVLGERSAGDLIFVADPEGLRLFKARMLANMTAAEVAATRAAAGTIEIALARMALDGELRGSFDYSKYIIPLILDFTKAPLKPPQRNIEEVMRDDSQPHSSIDVEELIRRTQATTEGVTTREYMSPGEYHEPMRGEGGYGMRSPTQVPYLRPVPKPAEPAPPKAMQKSLELGHTKVEKGDTAGTTIEIKATNHTPDKGFSVQQISLTVIGVRPGADPQNLERTVEELDR